jgi:hypothetical protein
MMGYSHVVLIVCIVDKVDHATGVNDLFKCAVSEEPIKSDRSDALARPNIITATFFR